MLPQSLKEKDSITYAVHTQLRKDFERFLSVGNRWTEMDQATFDAVKQYYVIHTVSLRHHHDAEDRYFFPVFKKMNETIATSIHELETQHEKLNDKLNRLDQAFAKNERTELEALFKDYCAFVEGHLNKEEDEVWKPIADTLTKQELDTIAAPIAKNTPQKILTIKMPWFVDAMDEGMREDFFKTVPFFVPWLYRWSMKKRFADKQAVFQKLKA